MNDENEQTEGNKQSLSALLRQRVDRFVFEMEAGPLIQGRGLTWAMAATLTERMPDPDALADMAAARVFVGSTSGVVDPDKPDDLVSRSLPPELVQQLTDSDVARFALEYLSAVAKQVPSEEPIRQFAKIAREEAARSAEMIRKTSATMRELFDRNLGYAAILKNIDGLNSANFKLGSNMNELMAKLSGPSKSLADSVGGAMEQFRKNSIQGQIEAILNTPAMRAAEHLKQSNLAAQVQSNLDSPAQKALDALGAGTASPSWATLGPALDSRLVDRLRPPPIDQTPDGRTAKGIEKLANAAERFEGLMETVVQQVGTTAELVGGVTQAIKDEAREFERKTAAQTKSAIGYAKWSFIVSAVALAISAGVAVLDRVDSTDDSREAAARARSELSELTQLKQRLDEQITLQRRELEVTKQVAERQAETAAAQAARIMALEEKARHASDAPDSTRR